MLIPQSFMSAENAALAQAFRAILGRKITRRRKDTRWSQEALANESGWSRQQLSRVENGISSIGAVARAEKTRPSGLRVSSVTAPVGAGRLESMKKFSKHTPEQIVVKLDKARSLKESGSTVAEVCRELGISEATYHRWQRQYGDMTRSEARRFKELQEENEKLKRLLGEAELEKSLLRELAEGKF
ncbi:helix-turn-helix domain-containing protein [Arcanobacterium haemolyticum]|nr:helix-turn-helix domain-containing protein [Arcanobacterium haemolyticum]